MLSLGADGSKILNSVLEKFKSSKQSFHKPKWKKEEVMGLEAKSTQILRQSMQSNLIRKSRASENHPTGMRIINIRMYVRIAFTSVNYL